MILQEKLDSYKEEAAAKNLELLHVYSENNVWRGIYIRKDCGHTIVKQVDNVRNNVSTFCKQCSEEKLEFTCETKGVTLLSESVDSDTTKRRIRVNDCGHELTVVYSNLYKAPNSKFKCSECAENRFNNVLQKIGASEILPDEKEILPNRQRKYKFDACGHTFICSPVKLSTKKCKVCKKKNFSDLVDKRNLILNGKAKDITRPKRYLNFTFKECGHERDIDPVCIERNNFKCIECNTSYLNTESNIYLYRIDDGDFSFLKLGYGKNVNRRHLEYGLRKTASVEILFSKSFIDGRHAQKIEHKIHLLLKKYNLPSDVMKVYLSNTGYTECYSISEVRTILYLLNQTYEGETCLIK